MYQDYLNKTNRLTRSQKLKKTQNLKEMVDKIYETDNEKGKEIRRYIDESIKELIVLLNAIGLNTVSSCEGFIRKPYRNINGKIVKLLTVSQPYVIISPVLQQGKNHKINIFNVKPTKKLDQQIIEYFYNVTILLGQFYKKRKVPYDIMITPHIHNCYSIELTNTGSEFLEKLGRKEKEKKLAQYQKEWQIFTEFLRNLYFGK
jgi:hypothetical protein